MAEKGTFRGVGSQPGKGERPNSGPDNFRLAPAFAFVGPFTSSQPMEAGKILTVGATVSPGGSFSTTHGLGRIPVYVQILQNSGFPGDAYILTSSSTSATIVVENHCYPGTFFYIT